MLCFVVVFQLVHPDGMPLFSFVLFLPSVHPYGMYFFSFLPSGNSEGMNLFP